MSSLDLVPLAPVGRSTTRAGFGCSGLMGALSRRQSLALLEAAWDAGIRHYDVAPLYGHGEAESVLGEFLQHRRDQVTLATKFGLEPTASSPLMRLARNIARPLAKFRPSRPQTASAPSAASAPPRAPLTASAARLSLECSLKALRTDTVDILLLHEATAQTLNGDELLGFLESAVSAGRIRSFGVGGDSRNVPALLEKCPRYCPVIQCDLAWNDAGFPPVAGNRIIVFGALSRLDRSAAPDLARTVLRAAALKLPESVILFSSRNPAHIASSVNALSDSSLDSAAREWLLRRA